MATIYNFWGWEANNTSEPFFGTGGAISTSTIRSGTYSWRSNPVTTGTSLVEWGGERTAPGVVGVATNRQVMATGFAIHVTTAPSAAERIWTIRNSGNSIIIALSIRSDRRIEVRNGTGTLHGTSTEALALGAWNYVVFTVNRDNSTLRLRIFDSSDIQVEDLLITGVLATNTVARGTVGKDANTAGSGYDIYFDDCYVATEDIGPVKVISAAPSDNGTDTGWTLGAGTSKHQSVSTPDGDTTYITSSSATDAYSAQVPSYAVAPGYGVKAVMPYAIIREETAANTSSVSVGYRLGGATAGTSGHDPAGNYAVNAGRLGMILNEIPGGGGPWSKAQADALQPRVLNNNATVIRCTWLTNQILLQRGLNDGGVRVDIVSQDPGSGVEIGVTPNDILGQGTGITPFVRFYPEENSLEVTAPPSAEGLPFARWERDGASVTSSLLYSVPADVDMILRAVYGWAEPITGGGGGGGIGGAKATGARLARGTGRARGRATGG
jgi:hypothetical protein